MNAEPVILVLDDERAQILSLRAQLKGLGKLVEFTDPAPALEYARGHACDAAIVDIGMPRAAMDGLEFLRSMREFDRELAIIIRTGSDSDQIADGAIELRAIKRAVKSKTTLAELRRSTQEAIVETRQRRAVVRNAAAADFTRGQLTEALGTYDLRQAAAELQRGLIEHLRGQLTGLSALASVLQADADASGRAAYAQHAAQSAALVSAMIGTLNEHLDGPFGDRRGGRHSGVNDSLRALQQFFRGSERWSGESKHVRIRDLISDSLVESEPLELLNGLRHLVEYLLLQCPPATEVTLTAMLLLPPDVLGQRVPEAGVVLNAEEFASSRPAVAFRAAACLPQLSLPKLRDDFSAASANPRIGNLHVLSRTVSESRGVVVLAKSAAGMVSVETLLPVAF
jgi:CheY-like chemotaxis protein